MSYTCSINGNPCAIGIYVQAADYGMREATIVVPYADGVKDVSDGKERPSTVTIGGRLYGSRKEAWSEWANMVGWAQAVTEGDTITQVYTGGGAGTLTHFVSKVQSATCASVEGSAGRWLDVSITFVGYEPGVS